MPNKCCFLLMPLFPVVLLCFETSCFLHVFVVLSGSGDETEDSFSINLAELGAGTPVSVSDGHLKAVYQQLGGMACRSDETSSPSRVEILRA